MNVLIPQRQEVWLDKTGSKEVAKRIIRVDQLNGQVQLINVFGKKAAPRVVPLSDIVSLIEIRKWERVVNEPFWWLIWPTAQLYTRGTAADQSRKILAAERARDRNFRLVEIVLRQCQGAEVDGRIRSRIVARLARLVQCHPDTIESLVRNFWQGGGNINALIPKTFLRGAPGKARITAEVPNEAVLLVQEKRRAAYLAQSEGKPRKYRSAYRLRIPDDILLMQQFAKKHILKKGGMSWRRGYKELIGLHYSRPIVDHLNQSRREPLPFGSRPSFGQFLRHGARGLSPEQKSKLMLGRRGHALKGRGLGGVANFAAQYPSEQYEIDATTADLILLDRTRRFSIGRPILYLVVDTWSQAIVGFAVTLENASYITATDALYCAIRNKREFAEELKFTNFIPSDWPQHGLPVRILADNAELRGLKANLLVQNLKIDVQLARSKRPDDKPFAEGAFHSTDCRSIRWLPGATRKKEYGDPPSSDSAQLTLDDFEKLIFISCIQANSRLLPKFPQSKAMLGESKTFSPNSAWDWGKRNLRGNPGSPPAQLTRINMLTHATGELTEAGLDALGMIYDCPNSTLRQAKIEARSGKSVSVPFAYDKRRIGTIWIRPPGGTTEIIAVELNDRYAGRRDWSYDEVKLWERRVKDSDDEAIDQELATYSNYSPLAQGIIAGAKKAATIERPKKSIRTAADANWHDVRISERDERRAGKTISPGETVAKQSVEKTESDAKPKRTRTRYLEVMKKMLPTENVQDE